MRRGHRGLLGGPLPHLRLADAGCTQLLAALPFDGDPLPTIDSKTDKQTQF